MSPNRPSWIVIALQLVLALLIFVFVQGLGDRRDPTGPGQNAVDPASVSPVRSAQVELRELGPGDQPRGESDGTAAADVRASQEGAPSAALNLSLPYSRGSSPEYRWGVLHLDLLARNISRWGDPKFSAHVQLVDDAVRSIAFQAGTLSRVIEALQQELDHLKSRETPVRQSRGEALQLSDRPMRGRRPDFDDADSITHSDSATPADRDVDRHCEALVLDLAARRTDIEDALLQLRIRQAALEVEAAMLRTGLQIVVAARGVGPAEDSVPGDEPGGIQQLRVAPQRRRPSDIPGDL